MVDRYDDGMWHSAITTESRTYCLVHQRPEDRRSPRGLVCRECQSRLQTAPPRGELRSYWESQPAAYALDGSPCWVYTLVWDDFRIRSMHWNGEQGLGAGGPSTSVAEWGAEVRLTGQME